MGNKIKKVANILADNDNKKDGLYKFIKIEDKYLTVEHVQAALRKSGIESCNLIFGIDYTSSNNDNGFRTFCGRSLHTINADTLNPYQHVITLLGKNLEFLDEDKMIDAFGFGDIRTKNHFVFSLKEGSKCYTFNEVLYQYNLITPQIQLSGPTSFRPLIKHAIEIVKYTGSYHILIILTDGEIIDKNETAEAIIEATKYPLSIIAIGVGDCDFSEMKKYDDELPKRKFDNFQFVNYNEIIKDCQTKSLPIDSTFLVRALQEIPDQYDAIKKLNLLNIVRSTYINNQYCPNFIHI